MGTVTSSAGSTSPGPAARLESGRVFSGLSSGEAQRRLTESGPNEIRREQATNALTLLVRQFASPVIWLLLVATVLSAAVGEWLDAIAIGAIVILNAVIGFFQEHRAERAVMALPHCIARMGAAHGVIVGARAWTTAAVSLLLTTSCVVVSLMIAVVRSARLWANSIAR